MDVHAFYELKTNSLESVLFVLVVLVLVSCSYLFLFLLKEALDEFVEILAVKSC